jgi:hypothetical protein
LGVFSGATEMTIAVWIKVTTVADWQKVLDVGINADLAIPNTTGMIYMYLAPMTSSGTNVTFGIAADGINNEQSLAGASSIGPSDGWTHLAVVLGASTATLYVNGKSAASKSKTSLPLRPIDLGTINYAWLGRSQFTNDSTFDGALDEFRVYNRELSADEILALYQYAAP